jgi:hypothetical protein
VAIWGLEVGPTSLLRPLGMRQDFLRRRSFGGPLPVDEPVARLTMNCGNERRGGPHSLTAPHNHHTPRLAGYKPRGSV